VAGSLGLARGRREPEHHALKEEGMRGRTARKLFDEREASRAETDSRRRPLM